MQGGFNKNNKLIVNINEQQLLLNISQQTAELKSILVHDSTKNSQGFSYAEIKDGVLKISEKPGNIQAANNINIKLIKPLMFSVKNIVKGDCQNSEVSQILISLFKTRRAVFRTEEQHHKQTFESLLPKGTYEENTINQEPLHTGVHFNCFRRFRMATEMENSEHLFINQIS